MTKRDKDGKFATQPTEAEQQQRLWEMGVAKRLCELSTELTTEEAAAEAKRLVDYAYRANYVEKRPVDQVLLNCLKYWRTK